MTNKCIVLLCCALAVVPAFGAQRVAMRPRPSVDSADQELIREIVDLERQGRGRLAGIEPYPGGQHPVRRDHVRPQPELDGVLVEEGVRLPEHMVVRVYGDTAVVTARADVKGHQLGEDFSGPYRYTRVWVRRSGHWQTVSYQATVTE